MATYTKIFNERESYQGYILNDLYHGNGIIKYLNHSLINTYEGSWLNGEYDGEGTLIHNDGSIYIGSFKLSQKHGYGKMYSANGKYLYDGTWTNNNIKKPIFKMFLDKKTNLTMCGYVLDGISLNGWFFIYNNNLLEKIVYYDNEQPLKEILFNYKNERKTRCSYNVQNIDMYNLFNNFINKIEFSQIQTFITDESKKQILDTLSYHINSKLEKTILDRYFEYVQLNIYDNTNNLIRYEVINDEELIVGNYNINDNKYYDAMLFKKKIKRKTINELIKMNDDTFNYKGIFENYNGLWLLDGYGIEKLSIYNYFEGIYSHGRITCGKYYVNNILIYDGYFQNNYYHGVGKLFDANGGIKYEGQFYNSKYHGNGTSYIGSNIEYIGIWNHGLKHGLGTLFSNTGEEIYTGNFENDQII